MQHQEMISGSVAAVVFQNEENGYTVLRLESDGGETVTVVGTVPMVTVGERLVITGKWGNHSAYGRQFEAELLERLMPETSEEIVAYLSSGIIKGIGLVTAQRIVKQFGSRSLEVLENEPERLTVISGISKKKAQEISQSFGRQVGLRRLMEFLAEHHLKPELALRLYRIFGQDAVEAVQQDPYLLTEAEFGAAFSSVDEFAMELGLDADDPRRVEAGVLFELEHNLGNGHTFLPMDKLTAATAALLDLDAQTIAGGLGRLEQTRRLVADELQTRTVCYLPAYYDAETYIAAKIRQMTQSPKKPVAGLEKKIDAIEKANCIVYAQEQRQAIAAAAAYPITVITGGPGTGKTTTLGGILDMFDELGLKTQLAAPTGRAAKRLTELTGREATTIHRLLEAQYSQDTGRMEFYKGESEPLKLDALVIDETSMVDLLLMQAVLKALPEGCKLLLVGDPDQLPSVGAGNFFSDLIRSGAAVTVRLTQIFRQAQQSLIVMNAHAVNQGQMPDLQQKDRDFFFLKKSSPDAVVQTIEELCKTRLPNWLGIDPWEIQVLSPTRKYETGTQNLNARLQKVLNPPDERKREKQYGGFTFREGDRVMQIRNNYDILWKRLDGLGTGAGIFNGDIGRIEEIDFAKEQMVIVFDDRVAEYDFGLLSDLEAAYAMTVHKSQGSEYKAVVLAACQGSPRLLCRNVLYTAITRAKDLLVIVGRPEVIAAMTENNRQQKRYSGLKLRLEAANG